MCRSHLPPKQEYCIGQNYWHHKLQLCHHFSAIGNDYGYENVFSREIEAVGKPEDILIGITTSGNSKNILKAVEMAKSMNIMTYIFTGNSGGEIQSKAKCLNVPSEITARIQECHIMIGQIICGIVEAELFKEN